MNTHHSIGRFEPNRNAARAILACVAAGILIFSAGNVLATDESSGLENFVLEINVRLALLTELGFDSLQVGISVNDGDVTLSGTVGERQTRELSKSVVAAVEGVESVKNNIKLEDRHGEDTAVAGAVEELERETNDSILATKVKLKLMNEVGDDALSIHVEASDGTVVLSGNVDAETDIEHAKKAAASVEGVTDVVNRISMKG